MTDEIDEHRELLEEARTLEQRRVEIVAQAIERNVADLLPATWSRLNQYRRTPFVSVSFETGLEEIDGERMSERDCRKFISFVGEIADRRRLELEVERYEAGEQGDE